MRCVHDARMAWDGLVGWGSGFGPSDRCVCACSYLSEAPPGLWGGDRGCTPRWQVLLDMDETLIAGARTSAYFFAINHFIKFGPNFPTAEPTEEG